MPRETNRLDPLQRRLIYGLSALLLLSGLLWFALDRFVQVAGDFGPVKHPWQRHTLVLHGTAALLYLLVLGSLLSYHIKCGWAQPEHRRQAVALLSLQGILVVTTPVLYYAGHENLRAVAANLHLIAGILLGAMLPVHIWLGRRAVQNAEPQRP